MSVKNLVFLQLYNAKGEAVSGEELAKNLSVTRAAVWKAVKALREEGYNILSSTNRGYSLATTTEQEPLKLPLDAALLGLGVKIVHLDTVNSTNSYAQALHTDKPTLILADCQTDGKARHHQEFSSPAGEGIYMSLLYFPQISLSEVSDLSERATSIVAEAVGGEKREQAIFINDKKIGGVLVEVTADQDGVEKAIVGIGIYTACTSYVTYSSSEKNTLIVKIVKQLMNI